MMESCEEEGSAVSVEVSTDTKVPQNYLVSHFIPTLYWWGMEIRP